MDEDLTDLFAHNQRRAQIGAINRAKSEIQQLLGEIRQLKAAEERGPKCPFCGGTIKLKNAEPCQHCRSKLAWEQGVVCKPGQETRVRKRLEQRAEERAAEAAKRAAVKAAKKAQIERDLPAARKSYKKFRRNELLGVVTIGIGVLGVISVPTISFLIMFLRIDLPVWFLNAAWLRVIILVPFLGGLAFIALGLFFAVWSGNRREALSHKFGKHNLK